MEKRYFLLHCYYCLLLSYLKRRKYSYFRIQLITIGGGVLTTIVKVGGVVLKFIDCI